VLSIFALRAAGNLMLVGTEFSGGGLFACMPVAF